MVVWERGYFTSSLIPRFPDYFTSSLIPRPLTVALSHSGQWSGNQTTSQATALTPTRVPQEFHSKTVTFWASSPAKPPTLHVCSGKKMTVRDTIQTFHRINIQ